METFIPKLGLTGLTSEALVEKGDNHVTMCTGLAWLTLPAGFLTGLSGNCAQLKRLDQEVLFNGGRVTFQAKHSMERKVRGNIRDLCGYVQAQSGGDLERILATGFEVRRKGAPVERIAMVQDLRNELTNVSGTVELRWPTVEHGINYKVFGNAGDPLKEEDWKLLGYTSKGRFTATDLESGKFYSFRVQAQGRKGLEAQVSQAVRVLAA